jgi:DNA-binding Lrp family transcriptional regulator
VGESVILIGLTMIKVRPDQEKSVYAHLQERPEVRDVYRLFGEYSFFLVMQAKERNGLGHMLSEIRATENVIKTGPVLLTVDKSDAEIRQSPDFAASLV